MSEWCSVVWLLLRVPSIIADRIVALSLAFRTQHVWHAMCFLRLVLCGHTAGMSSLNSGIKVQHGYWTCWGADGWKARFNVKNTHTRLACTTLLTTAKTCTDHSDPLDHPGANVRG